MLNLLLTIIMFSPVFIETKTKISAPPSVQKELTAYTPANTVIIFDLHDVLLHKNISMILRCFLKHGSPFHNIPSKARTKIKEARDKHFSADAYTEICNRYNLPKKAAAFNAYGHAYYIKKEMLELLTILKDKGYTLILASNIGKSGLEEFLSYKGNNKDKRLIAQSLNLFDHYYVVDYTQKQPIIKPNPSYFKNLKEAHPQWTHYIFIDDKKENISAARNERMLGLLFKSLKKLNNQLINELKL